jgi:hypothetical protein
MPYTGASTTGGGTDPTPPPKLAHHHDQPTPATEWVIVHGLAFRPAGVLVHGTDGAPIHGDISHDSPTTTRIRFAIPIAGSADLS